MRRACHKNKKECTSGTDASVSFDRTKTVNIFWVLGAEGYSRLCHNSETKNSHLRFWSANVQKLNSKDTLWLQYWQILIISCYRQQAIIEVRVQACKLFLLSKNTIGCRQLWKVRLIHTRAHLIRKPKFVATGRRLEASAAPTKPLQKLLSAKVNIDNRVKVLIDSQCPDIQPVGTMFHPSFTKALLSKTGVAFISKSSIQFFLS